MARYIQLGVSGNGIYPPCVAIGNTVLFHWNWIPYFQTNQYIQRERGWIRLDQSSALDGQILILLNTMGSEYTCKINCSPFHLEIENPVENHFGLIWAAFVMGLGRYSIQSPRNTHLPFKGKQSPSTYTEKMAARWRECVIYIYIDRYKVCSCYPGDCIRGQKNQCSIFGICHFLLELGYLRRQLECNGICKHLDINGLSKYMYIHSIMEPTSLMEYNGIYKHLYRQLQVDNMYVSRQYNGIQKHKSNIYARWVVLLIFDFFFLLGDPGWQVYHLPSSSQP